MWQKISSLARGYVRPKRFAKKNTGVVPKKYCARKNYVKLRFMGKTINLQLYYKRLFHPEIKIQMSSCWFSCRNITNFFCFILVLTKILTKISIFGQTFDFRPKILIFGQNFDSLQNEDQDQNFARLILRQKFGHSTEIFIPAGIPGQNFDLIKFQVWTYIP